MKVDEDSDSTLSTQVTTFNIGSRENPYPIYIDLMDIGDTLKQQYWTNKMYKRYRIVQKKSYLMRALEDYADFEGVKELKGNRKHAWYGEIFGDSRRLNNYVCLNNLLHYSYSWSH